MSTTLTLNAVTATTATIAFTNLPVGGSVEIQVASNPDFRGLTSMTTYAATPAVVAGLNQRGTYYARGRTVTAGGVRAAWGQLIGFRTADGVAWDTAPQAVMVTPGFVVVPEPYIRFLVNNFPVAGYPIENLLRDDPQLIYSSLGPAFTIETSGAPIDVIAFLDTLAPEGATIGLKAGTTQAQAEGGAPAFSLVGQTFRASTNLPHRRGYHSLIRLAAPQAYRFWRITIDNALQQGAFYARYMVMGLARTAKNIAADKVEAPLDLGSIDRNRAGQPDRVWGHKMRKVDFEIAMMTEMQWETQFNDLWRVAGTSEPVLVVPNARTGAFLHDRILYGTISQQRAIQPNSPRFSQGFSIESLI